MGNYIKQFASLGFLLLFLSFFALSFCLPFSFLVFPSLDDQNAIGVENAAKSTLDFISFVFVVRYFLYSLPQRGRGLAKRDIWI